MKQVQAFVTGSVLWCSFALLTGCTSSELVDVWNDPSSHAPALKQMLVISAGKNPVQRRLWEDAFCAELGQHSVAATSSYRSFPDAVPDTNEVIATVRSNGLDGVLVIRRLPTETYPHYVDGYVTVEQDMRYNRRWDRFVIYYRDIDHAAYVDSQRVDIRAFDVWTTGSEGRLIWSGTSKTPEPNTTQTVRPEIVTLVVSELTQHGVIAPKR